MVGRAKQIDLCIKNRAVAAQLVAQTIQGNPACSEIELHAALLQALGERSAFYPEGWYQPPPKGVAVLFAHANDQFERSKFPTLRTAAYWSSPNYMMDDETVGMVYVSPVDTMTGIICDIGFNFYRGKSSQIHAHLAHCLETVETIAEQAQVGMQFTELYKLAQELVHDSGLHNDWMITYNDPTRAANFGHTYPWTYEPPTPQEQHIIDAGDFDTLKEIISKKRLFINPIENFTIPETIVFSIEARLGSKSDRSLPCGYYYALVAFLGGVKRIITDLNPIFEALDIHYMRSTY